MTKILVLSDSHGNIDGIKKVLDKEKDYDYVFHLGDYITDMDGFLKLLKQKAYCVRGNCDGGSFDLELNLSGVKILLTHGNDYKVKYSLTRLFLKAQEGEYNLVCFGHTHVPTLEVQNGITLFNPGALSKHGKGCYGIIEIDNGNINARFKEI